MNAPAHSRKPYLGASIPLADMLTVSFVGKKFTCDVQLEVCTQAVGDGGLNLVLRVCEKSAKMSTVPGPTLASLNVSIARGRNDVTKCKEILSFLKDQALPKTLKFISINRTRGQKREQQGEGLRLLNCIWPGKYRGSHDALSGEIDMSSEIRAATELTGAFPALVTDDERAGEETQLNTKSSHRVCGGEEEHLCSEMLSQVQAGEAIFGSTKRRSWNEKDMFRGFCAQRYNCTATGINTYAKHSAGSLKTLGKNVESHDSCTKQTDYSVKENQSESKKVEISSRRRLNEELVSQLIQNATPRRVACSDVSSLAKEIVAKIVARAKTRYMLEVFREESVGMGSSKDPDLSARIVWRDDLKNKTRLLKCEDPVSEHCQMVKESRIKEFEEKLTQQTDGVTYLPCQTYYELASVKLLEECNFQEHESLLAEIYHGRQEEEQFTSDRLQDTVNCIHSDYKTTLQGTLCKLVTQEETTYNETLLAHQISQEEIRYKNPQRRHFVKLYDVANCQGVDRRATGDNSMTRYLSSVVRPEACVARVYNTAEPLRCGQLCQCREVGSDFMKIKQISMHSTAWGIRSKSFTDSPDRDALQMKLDTEVDGDRTDLRNSLVFLEDDDIIPDMEASFDSSICQGFTGSRRSTYRRTMSESQMPERKRWLPGELSDTSLSSEFDPMNLSSKRRSASCPVVTEEDIIIENMESHHQDVCETLARRTWVIMNVQELWNAGKPLDAIKLCITLTGMGAFDGHLRSDSESNSADPSMTIDHVLFLNILQQLPSSCTLWNLDMCLLLLPKLRGFISTGSHTSHVEMACSILHVVIKKVHIVIRRVQKAARSPTRDIIQMIRDATSELREIKEKTRHTVQALDKCDVTHRIEDIATLKPVLRELHVALEVFLNTCTVQ